MTDLAIQLHEGNRRLDAIDRKILSLLQTDSRMTMQELAEKVDTQGYDWGEREAA